MGGIEWIDVYRIRVRRHRWQRARVDIRHVPADYLPFQAAYLASLPARDALRVVAPLLHVPIQEATDTINAALWDTGGEVLRYFVLYRQAREFLLASEPLEPGHPARVAALETVSGINRMAGELDKQITTTCREILRVCESLVIIRDTIAAEDQTRAAFRRADRMGAYSGPPGRDVVSQDLSDRIAGLRQGLRQMSVA